MAIKTFIGLVLMNLAWSLHPIMGKLVLMDFPSPQAAWLRYFSAFLAYAVYMTVFRRGRQVNEKPAWVRPQTYTEALILFLLGFFAFCFSPLTQFLGLSTALATENAIIVAMEPMLTATLACLVLKERVSYLNCLSFALALLGFFALAGIYPGSDVPLKFSGNFLILISLFGESAYSILGKKLLERHSPLAVFGTSLTLGLVCLTAFAVGTSPEGFGFFYSLNHFTWRSALAVLWMGPFGTFFGYLYMLVALEKISVISMSLLLFIQPLAGAFWGYLFFGDRMGFLGNVGAGLILLAVALPLFLDLLNLKIKLKKNKLDVQN
jgi:drug/metabolite transporter (DMT)-like permease